MDSAYAKHGRAQKHLAELQASVESYRAGDLSNELSYVVTYPFGDADERAVLTLRVSLRAPSEWNLIMGDILTNLRAAHDHAVYGHAMDRAAQNCVTPTSSQRDSLYHPTAKSSAEWQNKRAALQALLDPAVLAVIEKNQPFNGNGDVNWHGLTILGVLVNRDKHKAVHEIPINVASLALGDNNLDIISEGTMTVLPDHSAEKEITIRRRQRRSDGETRHSMGTLALSTEFLEQIDIPNTGQRSSFIGVMEQLTAHTGGYLDELKAAGC